MREREGSILARESPKECCQHLAGELDESGGSCLAREGGQQPPLKRLGDQSRTGSVGAIIEPHDLPRAGKAPAEPEPEPEGEGCAPTRSGWAVQHLPTASESVCVTSEDRQASDLRRAEIQSTSYLVGVK